MNKYKVGDKIVLTVSDVNEKAYYSYYVFNNNDLILWEPSTDNYAEPLSTYTEQARADGAETAWELVRKIFDMETNDIEDIFIKEDAWNLGTVLNNYTYQEAAAKVAEWEKAKEEIKVGDVLEYIYDSNVKCVAINLYPSNTAYLVFDDGTAGIHKLDAFKKTSRSMPVDSFLKQIGEE